MVLLRFDTIFRRRNMFSNVTVTLLRLNLKVELLVITVKSIIFSRQIFFFNLPFTIFDFQI